MKFEKEEIVSMGIKQFIIRHPKILRIALALQKYYVFDISLYKQTKTRLNQERSGKKRIYYLGIPAHTNLGDLAQGMCIRNWLHKHYSDRQIIEIETNALVNTHKSALNLLERDYTRGDIIVFQSGYTTTDLGGYADEMHRAVMKVLPEAKMLMLPQTIFFKSEKNEKRTSECYNSMKHMLFLARDEVSYDKAKEMFKDIPVKMFPDIVTSLIGTMHFSHERKGILFCCRADSEKYYSDEEIDGLIAKLQSVDVVSKTDTTKHGHRKEIVNNANKYIMNEIDNYSQYRCIITDRYHGTIFSLIASTPVIVIKTTDHKVTTGVNWFKGVYDNHVFRADDLSQVYDLVKKIYAASIPEITTPYFEKTFYDKLPEIFDKAVGE